MRQSLFRAVASIAVAVSCALPAFASGKRLAWIELEKDLPEQPSPTAALMGPGGAPTLREVTAGLRRAAKDATVAGVVLRLREPELTRTQAEEIGAAMRAVRDAGKKVHLFTEVYGPTEVVLASYADQAIIQKGGAVSLPGMYMEEMFLADTLGWLGVKADFVQIGDYKGAKEQFANSAPSKEWDQNINGLLDSLYGEMRRQIGAGRKLSDERLDAAMREAWMATGEDAVRLGLLDAEADRMDVDALLEKSHGEHESDAAFLAPAKAAAPANPFAMLETIMNPPSRDPVRDTVAVLHIDGTIVDGDSKRGGVMGGSSVGSLTVRRALAEIEAADLVKGLIVRINSPGGSAIASESIWQGVRRVAAKKPVWVSVGSMAASGGYYIAVAGDRVYVNPSSIVGSIGVVGGKMALGGLYEKVRVNVVGRARGPRAEIMSTRSVWSDADRALVTQKMKQTYDQFVERVRAGRKGIDVAQTAEGRLFAGEKAVALKMADAVGGFDDTARDLAAKLGLKEGEFDLMDYPAPKTIAEIIKDAMEQFGIGASSPEVSARTAGAAVAGAVREAVGPQAWPAVRDALEGLMQVRSEPILLISPRAVVVR